MSDDRTGMLGEYYRQKSRRALRRGRKRQDKNERRKALAWIHRINRGNR